MYRRRRHNGRFISREEVGKRELRRLVLYITFPIAFWAVTQYVQYAVAPIDSPFTLPTTPTAQAWEPERDVCGLRDVVCPDEEPVVEAITAISTAIGHEVTEETKKRVRYLYDRAEEAGVPFKDAVKTVYCESQWIAQKSALQEESYGISQIHLPSHPHVTQAQAMDAYYAIDFLVDNWYEVAWYGYDRESGQCANPLHIDL